MKGLTNAAVGWALAAALLALAPGPAAAAPRVEIGREAPALSLETIDGERLDAGALRGDKSLVLVFFRGTW